MGSNQVNLISTKEQIGEFIQDFNISSAGYVNTFNRHISRAIQIIGIDTYFIRCYKKELVDNNRVIIPCNIEYLELVVTKIGNYICPIDLDNNNIALIKELDLVNSPSLVGYINHPYLEVNLDDNTPVYIIYKSLPIGKDSYIKIPNDGLLREAINFWLIYKMGLSGYKHPVVSRKEAYQEWNRLYPQARNSVNFPTVEEMQRFTEMWQNPIIGDNYNNLFIE